MTINLIKKNNGLFYFNKMSDFFFRRDAHASNISFQIYAMEYGRLNPWIIPMIETHQDKQGLSEDAIRDSSFTNSSFYEFFHILCLRPWRHTRVFRIIPLRIAICWNSDRARCFAILCEKWTFVEAELFILRLV